MSRNTLAPVLRQLDAEDRVVGYLAALPKQLAVVTAVRAARTLRNEADDELVQMRKLGSRRKVFLPTSQQLSWLAAAEHACRRDPLWQSCSWDGICDLVRHLPRDQAAFAVYRAAR